MAQLNLRHISTTALKVSNLIGKTSLKRKAEWSFISHEVYAEKNGANLHCDVYIPKVPGKKPAVLVVHGEDGAVDPEKTRAFTLNNLRIRVLSSLTARIDLPLSIFIPVLSKTSEMPTFT